MSSDDYIFVDGSLNVLHCCASVDHSESDPGTLIGTGKTLVDALRIAKSFGYVEYGLEISDDLLREEEVSSPAR